MPPHGITQPVTHVSPRGLIFLIDTISMDRCYKVTIKLIGRDGERHEPKEFIDTFLYDKTIGYEKLYKGLKDLCDLVEP